ncbi:MAG: hypothetical protein NWR72_09050 [Bacteroidia bacterium]|nr:hypothetical protein [Bacteroidia bacterium]
MKRIPLFILLSVFLFSACVEHENQSSANLVTTARDILAEPFEGILLTAPNGGTLYTRKNAEEIVFADPKGILAKQIEKDSLQGGTFFAQLLLAVGKPGEAFVLQKVDVISSQWWDDSSLMIQHIQALGNEPGWELRIDPPNDFILRTNYGADETTFPYVLPKVESGSWSYDVTIGMGENAEHLGILISSDPCNDNMAGNTFPFSAQVEWNGKDLRGCGRPLTDMPQARN